LEKKNEIAIDFLFTDLQKNIDTSKIKAISGAGQVILFKNVQEISKIEKKYNFF